jgi:saccharopine dehydrogenase-like NADP-dependent oxidoreductase
VSKNFEEPKVEGKSTVTCTVIGIKEGSADREVLFESTDHAEFLKAYKYHYTAGKYTMVLKEFNNKSGGIK